VQLSQSNDSSAHGYLIMSTQKLLDRVQNSSLIEQRLIANLLDTSAQFKDTLSTVLLESKQHKSLTAYWQTVIDVSLAATHASNVTANPQSEGLEQMITALIAPELLAELAPVDPLAAARLRGTKVKQELLYGDGSPLKSEEVAQLLGISRQAVDKRRSKGQLLAVSLGKRGYFYPLWQFQAGEILPGLNLVLATLASFDAWTQLMFLKTGDIRLNGHTPLECLIAGDVDGVVAAARCYGEPNPA
jgi:hypothetical protein